MVRLGRSYAEQLMAMANSEVVVPSEKTVLLEWLADDHVKGKFDWWWHRKIANAREWRIDVSPVWDALASLLGRLFPETCNQFNQCETRPPVTEELLYLHLEQSHGLSRDQIDRLLLVELLQLLQRDVEGSRVKNSSKVRAKRTQGTLARPREAKVGTGNSLAKS